MVGAEVVADDLQGVRKLVVMGGVVVKRGKGGYGGVREVFCHGDGPWLGSVSEWWFEHGHYGPLTHACPRADVEDPLRLGLVERREIQTANETGQDVVEEEQALHFLFVVGPRVPWCHTGMVRAEIDDFRVAK